MAELLYWKRDHIPWDDAPEGHIAVADSYEDPWLTMVPATLREVVAWVNAELALGEPFDE